MSSLTNFVCDKNEEKGNTFKYEEIIKDFQWNLPKYWNFAQDIVDKYANNSDSANNLAFLHVSQNLPDLSSKKVETRLTYKNLSDDSKIYANALRNGLQGHVLKKAIIILPRIPVCFLTWSAKKMIHF